MTTAVDQSRVLVVDDEPRTREPLRHLLAAEGYRVRTAEQGSRALTFVSEWRPALVITDLTMAPTNGIELCRHIRDESKTPIIVVSADNSERSKVATLDSGANDYVVKPFAPDELKARVRAALSAQPSPTTAARSTPAPSASTSTRVGCTSVGARYV